MRGCLLIVLALCLFVATPAPLCAAEGADRAGQTVDLAGAMEQGRQLALRAPKSLMPQATGEAPAPMVLAVGEERFNAEYVLSLCPREADHCAVVVRVAASDVPEVLRAIAGGDTPMLVATP